jgi:eight-cysteine-cluster-containing protein
MRILIVGLMLVLIFGCVIPGTPETGYSKPKTEFCGTSTYGSCNSDIDCVRGGCSNQYCHSTEEDPPITTCEYKECYSAGAYGVECSCVNNKCQWQ